MENFAPLVFDPQPVQPIESQPVPVVEEVMV